MRGRLRLEPRRDEDRAGASRFQFAGEVEVVEKRQVAWPGEVDGGDIGDAAVEVGARTRLRSGQRCDLADRQRRLRAEELRAQVRTAVHCSAPKMRFSAEPDRLQTTPTAAINSCG